MILADTSIWVDHFRSGDDELRDQLMNRRIAMHPFVVAELALGSLAHRATTLAYLEQLPSLRIARLDEVMQTVEARSLYSRGIGLVDAHLIASVFINPSTQLWTRDKRLSDTAKALGIHANLP
jgi:predicted nucleic acid-binding protein